MRSTEGVSFLYVQQILWLDVSVNDSIAVQVFDGKNELGTHMVKASSMASTAGQWLIYVNVIREV